LKKTVNVAVIGGAGWIGGVHSECYKRLALMMPDVDIELHTTVDVFEEPIKKAAQKYGFKYWSLDYNDVINNEEIDVVDICCSNDFHKEISIKAAEAGKHVLCEKPLAMNTKDAEEMYETVTRCNVTNMINFVYRKYPSIAYIREIISSGDIGRIYHVNCFFEQDFYADPEIPYNWHFKKAKAGGGALLTIAPHMIDTARYLIGDFAEATALGETFIKERKLPGEEGKTDIVDVDDATAFMVKFKNGAIGTFMTSWVARGRKHHFEFEIAGSKGTIMFNSERMNEIRLAEVENDRRKEGIKTILVGSEHPYGKEFNLKTGMGIGAKEAFTIQLGEFIQAVINKKQASPDFFDGLQAVKYTELIQEAADKKKWIKF